MKKLALGILFLFLLNPLLAQHKADNSTQWWPQVQFRYFFNNDEQIYLQHRWHIDSDSGFNQVGPAEQMQFRLGYEKNITDHWTIGLSERLVLQHEQKTIHTEPYVLHHGKIKSINFIKRAKLEHLWETDENRKSSLQVRLLAQLERSFKLGNVTLTPALSGEIFFFNDFDEADPNRWDERRVDQTRLRVALQVMPTERLAITPYFMREVTYRVLEPTFDANGEVKQPGGNWNFRRPIIGFDITYTLGSIAPRPFVSLPHSR